MNTEDLEYIITEGVRLIENEQGFEGVDLREIINFARQRYKVTPEQVKATIAQLCRKNKQATQVVGDACILFNI